MRVAALLLLIASAVGTPDELSDDGSVVMANGNATFVVRLGPRNAEALESVVRAAVLGVRRAEEPQGGWRESRVVGGRPADGIQEGQDRPRANPAARGDRHEMANQIAN